MPVVLADSQSTLPQAQASELAADPSDTEQVGGREQVWLEAVHFLNGAQSTLPQAQASELAADPSLIEQVGYWLHLFVDAEQNRPVLSVDSQSTLPQAQASELAAEPSDTEHVGILLHLLEVVQTYFWVAYLHLSSLNLKSSTLSKFQAPSQQFAV